MRKPTMFPALLRPGVTLTCLLAGHHALAQDEVYDAPATVVDHQLDVAVGATGVTEKETWTVQIHDPAAFPDGVPAPPGMDGARSGAASITGDRLVLPPGLVPGTSLSFATTRRSPRSASGVFSTAEDLPLLHAEVLVRAPASSPLWVWADPSSRSGYLRGGTNVARVAWDDLPRGEPGQLIWSTWTDWIAAGRQLQAAVTPKLATRRALGPSVAADLSGADVATLTERVYQLVALTEAAGTWRDARPALEVLRDGRGTAAERGVVLLSLLKEAGLDAHPALLRPPDAAGSAPTNAPAPALLTRPVIAVTTSDRTVWVDPAAEYVKVPELPAAMRGGLAWIPGDIPRAVRGSEVLAGRLSIQGSMNVNLDRSATFNATIVATGSAQEWLRERLAPLGREGREMLLIELLRRARPDVDRATVSATGIEGVRRPLKITVQGYQSNTVSPLGTGLVGQIPPLLAPALSAWLPANVLVREELVVIPPAGLHTLSAVSPKPAFHPDVTLTRTYRREADKIVAITEIERPEQARSAREIREAADYLHAYAESGPELALFGLPDGPVVSELRRAEGRDQAELAVLEAFLWWTVGKDRKASKAFQRGIGRAGFSELTEAVARHTLPGEQAPWDALVDLAELPTERMLVAQRMASAGVRRQAWLAAVDLLTTQDPQAQLEAALLVDRVQWQVAAEEDEELAAAWRDPATLLATAQAAATRLPDLPAAGEPRVLVRLAERALDEGRNTEAEALLEKAATAGDDSNIQVLLAIASARSGVPVADVVSRVHAAVASASFDPRVLDNAARAMAEVGDSGRAQRYGLASARLRFDDPDAWDRAVDLALRNHDLPVALDAARRASDFRPGSPDLATQLVELATLAHDRDNASIGRTRAPGIASGGDWPPPLGELMSGVPPEALLAVLVHHDEAVVADPMMLALRAQLQLDAGRLDAAARDGEILAYGFGRQEGVAIAFAATVGELWSPTADRDLDTAARTDANARATRMEHRLITGAGDALADARALADNPRAALILRTVRAPAAVAGEVEGWPPGLTSPGGAAPAGFLVNRVLSAVPGVSAWSDPVRGLAFLRLARPTGTLPPPLAQLYTAAEPPVASLADGGHILRLTGGALPLYAAVKLRNGHEEYGLGFTAQLAEQALRLAE